VILWRTCATSRRWRAGLRAISSIGRTSGSRCGRSDRGVRELRVRDRAGAFRVIYLATLADRIAVLHAFQKKTQRTAKHEIELAAKRFRELRKD
jgi:phage-related protein